MPPVQHSLRQVTSKPSGLQTWHVRLAVALGILVFFILFASAGYFLIEDYDWLESLYTTVITISTVGMDEVAPLSSAGRLWTMLVVIGGVMIGAVVLSLIVAMVVQGQIRSILGRRQLEHKIQNLSKHVIICGYGHMGRLIAHEVNTADRQVVVIDNDGERTTAAERAGLLYVFGDAQDEAVLVTAGIQHAAVLVAALATDASNVFLTLTARQANRDLTIIARAQEQATQDKLLIAGATRVVCPQILGATRMADIVLRPAVVDFVEISHRGVDLELDQLLLSEASTLVGKTLAELELPRRTGAHIVAVRRADGEAIYHPTPQLQLSAGDTIILVGKRGAAAAVEKLQIESG